MFDRTIIEDQLPEIKADPIAHYTRIGSLCHFLLDKQPGWSSAWATPVQFLNDRMELALGLEVLREVANQKPVAANRVRVIIDYLISDGGRLETDAFQMSFSGDPDELGQWRGYASNGMGCAIVTDALSVQGAADIAGWMVYAPKKQRAFAYKVLSRLRKVTDNDVIEKVIISAASYMKHDGFSAEKEFRLLKFPRTDDVRFRETGHRLVPFVDYLYGARPLPISRIIIGPGWQLSRVTNAEFTKNHVVQGIRRLLAARGLHGVPVLPSNIPYDPT